MNSTLMQQQVAILRCIHVLFVVLTLSKGICGLTSALSKPLHLSPFSPTQSTRVHHLSLASSNGLQHQTSSSFETATRNRLLCRSRRRNYAFHAVTRDKESTEESSAAAATNKINGKSAPVVSVDKETVNGETAKLSSSTATTSLSDFNSSHVSELFEEINRRITNGSTELLQNITTVVDEQMPQLNDSVAQELTEYLSDLAVRLQKAQQDEIQRQLDELEKLFLVPIERVAFSDAPLFEMDQNSKSPNGTLTDVQIEERALILAGENSTLRSSSRMRTRELIRNFNVAPLYYSIALLYRWFQKASYPSIYLLSAYKGMANLVKTSGGPRRRWRRKRRKKEGENDDEVAYEEYIKEAEAFQTGWKRTGEIAAKGPLAKKWAILRRSAEIWAYFSSFYLKDRRICNKYNSGKWSEEKFKAERSKLGAEITQNLLRLGPTFIKVR